MSNIEQEMNIPFKRGDLVKYIDEIRNNGLTNGRVYTLLLDEFDGFITIKNDKGITSEYYTCRFTPHTPNPITTQDEPINEAEEAAQKAYPTPEIPNGFNYSFVRSVYAAGYLAHAAKSGDEFQKGFESRQGEIEKVSRDLRESNLILLRLLKACEKVPTTPVQKAVMDQARYQLNKSTDIKDVLR